MSKERVLLGKIEEYNRLVPIYLSKHSWDCEWYWGLGYLGNANTHFHFSDYLKGTEWDVASIFTGGTVLTQSQWWVICDMFKQAYSLRATAEVYRLGGHICGANDITTLLRDSNKSAMLNADLELILDRLWDYIVEAVTKDDM
jgi:hypothetical protein